MKGIARHTGRAIFDAGLQAKAEAHAARAARDVVADVADGADAAETAAIQGVWRAQPPTGGGSISVSTLNAIIFRLEVVVLRPFSAYRTFCSAKHFNFTE